MTAIYDGIALEDLAALICSTLERYEVRVVLSSGSVVTIYSNNAYQSHDLDFIQTGLARRTDAAMEELGFARQGRHWVHSQTPYLVEFPPGPVQVGDTIVTEFAELPTRLGVLRLLAPTDCVMDRLAAFYHWNDRQCLEQALAVTRRHAIDLERVEKWSRAERAEAKFREFSERLHQAG